MQAIGRKERVYSSFVANSLVSVDFSWAVPTLPQSNKLEREWAPPTNAKHGKIVLFLCSAIEIVRQNGNALERR